MGEDAIISLEEIKTLNQYENIFSLAKWQHRFSKDVATDEKGQIIPVPVHCIR